MELYDLHCRTVYRYLMHMTGSISVAEELTQEVFVAVLGQPMRSFDPERGTLEGYLLGIARNLARQEYRRSLRLLSLDEMFENMDWSHLLSESWDHPEALMTQAEIKLMHRFILELPEHYRSVIVLCALQEKSYQDVARILQCSEGTVASRLNRAKGLLFAKLTSVASTKSDRREPGKGGPHGKAFIASR